MVRGVAISVGVLLLGVGIKAMIDDRWLWGWLTVLFGTVFILAAIRSYVLTRRFAHEPPLLVAYYRQPQHETLTFSMPPEKGAITKLILEPLASGVGYVLIDPPEVLFLHPRQPVTCTVCMQEGPLNRGQAGALVDFLERRRSGKMQVVARFTDAQGARRRLPFNVEIMGSHHQVEWVPGREQKAEPDW